MKNEKEKAKELVDKFCFKKFPKGTVGRIAEMETAKQCALLCVDEVLIEIHSSINGEMEIAPYYVSNYFCRRYIIERERLAFWNEVKTQINLL